MKEYKKDKESYVIYWEANNLCRWAMSQKNITDNFKWEKAYISLITIKYKTTMKIMTKDIYLRLMLNILNNCIIHTMICHFYQED